MIEAWQIKHRPWLYFFLRRLELCRWTLRAKAFHVDAKWYARLHALLLVLGGHETEICSYCGGKVGVVWWCDDSVLWETVTGWTNGGGVCCVQCFDGEAHKKRIPFLRWGCQPHEPISYSEDEWIRIINNNRRTLNKAATGKSR